MMYAIYASASVAGYAMILARHVEIIRAMPNFHMALRPSKSMFDNERSSHEKMDVAWQCISERLWKCLVGRYGGCFEEDIGRLMMTERIMPTVWMHRRSMRQLSR